jgi:hypothetical protein
MVRRRLEAENMDRMQKAHERARELFHAHLTPEQRETEKHSNLVKLFAPSGRFYHLHTSCHSGNVRLVDKAGITYEHLCCYLWENVPQYDHYLAQYMYLMADEETFRRTAVITKTAHMRLGPKYEPPPRPDAPVKKPSSRIKKIKELLHGPE